MKLRLLFTTLTLIFALSNLSRAQNSTNSIYTYEIQLSNSENLDYRMEQQAFLEETMKAIHKFCSFDKEKKVYIIRTKMNFDLTSLKSTIEAKGITVIGNIVKNQGNSTSNTH